MIIKQGGIINIQVYKHDGTLYRQWNGVKVFKTLPNQIVLFMYKTKVLEASGQKWIVREPTIWFFPKNNQFYNTTTLIRQSGIFFYTNLASPPIFEDNTLKFIDYDLDIKAYPKTSIKIVDRVEYAKNKLKYSYSKTLMNKIEKTSLELVELMKNQKNFFNKKVIDTYVQDLIKNKVLTKRLIKK